MIGDLVNSGNNYAASFEGKVAVFTTDHSIADDDYHSVDHLISKYGRDKILHRIWPVNFLEE